jgi:hypothetical protein
MTLKKILLIGDRTFYSPILAQLILYFSSRKQEHRYKKRESATIQAGSNRRIQRTISVFKLP